MHLWLGKDKQVRCVCVCVGGGGGLQGIKATLFAQPAGAEPDVPHPVDNMPPGLPLTGSSSQSWQWKKEGTCVCMYVCGGGGDRISMSTRVYPCTKVIFVYVCCAFPYAAYDKNEALQKFMSWEEDDWKTIRRCSNDSNACTKATYDRYLRLGIAKNVTVQYMTGDGLATITPVPSGLRPGKSPSWSTSTLITVICCLCVCLVCSSWSAYLVGSYRGNAARRANHDLARSCDVMMDTLDMFSPRNYLNFLVSSRCLVAHTLVGNVRHVSPTMA